MTGLGTNTRTNYGWALDDDGKPELYYWQGTVYKYATPPYWCYSGYYSCANCSSIGCNDGANGCNSCMPSSGDDWDDNDCTNLSCTNFIYWADGTGCPQCNCNHAERPPNYCETMNGGLTFANVGITNI